MWYILISQWLSVWLKLCFQWFTSVSKNGFLHYGILQLKNFPGNGTWKVKKLKWKVEKWRKHPVWGYMVTFLLKDFWPITFLVPYSGKWTLSGVWYKEREHFPCTVPRKVSTFQFPEYGRRKKVTWNFWISPRNRGKNLKYFLGWNWAWGCLFMKKQSSKISSYSPFYVHFRHIV